MLAQLKQLHPLPARKDVLMVASAMGMGIALFLVVFQPFGLHTVPGSPRKMAILGGYGMITFAVVAFNGIVMPAMLPRVYNPERWTLAKDLFLLGLMNFGGVALVNFFYSAVAFGFAFSFYSVLFTLFATLSVGFLPFSILVLYRHNKLLQQNLLSAANINAHIPAGFSGETEKNATLPANNNSAIVIASADAGTGKLTFHIDNLLYAESADNYIKVTTLENGTAKTTIVRQTLKYLEEQVQPHSHVIRCHRSFMVNLDKVRHAEGNAQGLKLEIEGSEAVVPVSRSYVPAVKALLNTP